ncbi:MAG: 50S ribosomal protein L4 [Armatimonadota bacterium]|nr:50S ribosomal protein L4 [Armatimonadota bacterium]
MVTVPMYNTSGNQVGEVELPGEVFQVQPKPAVVYQALVWQLAGRHLGTHSTKTRGEVAGGGRKPWRQKGTGRARHGSIRSPLWVGGGVVHGPKPRSYAFPLPKKVRRLAIRSILSARAKEGRIKVVEELRFPEPRTKELVEVLGHLGVKGKTLLVTAEHDERVERSAANLPHVKVLSATTLNVHDLLSYENIVVTRDALSRIAEVFGR